MFIVHSFRLPLHLPPPEEEIEKPVRFYTCLLLYVIIHTHACTLHASEN